MHRSFPKLSKHQQKKIVQPPKIEQKEIKTKISNSKEANLAFSTIEHQLDLLVAENFHQHNP
jgi:hypothetical protein